MSGKHIWISYLDETARAVPAIYCMTLEQAKAHAETIISTQATRQMRIFTPHTVLAWNYIHSTWSVRDYAKEKLHT